ncbi:MAG: 3-oxoacid CoA-transferase, partial [Chloroflexi bacterium]
MFRLQAGGLELIEIAPGVDIGDLINQLPFRVHVQEPVARMPEDIFKLTVAPFDLPKRPTGK